MGRLGSPYTLFLQNYAFALFLRILDFNGLAIRENFQGFQGVKKFLQKCSSEGKFFRIIFRIKK